MLKRIPLFVLGVLYLLSTVTTVIDVHYCMGRLSCVQWEHFGAPSLAEGCGLVASGRHCCRTEVKVFKVSDDHQRSASYFVSAPVPVMVQVAFSCIQTPLWNTDAVVRPLVRPPPLLPTSLTILNGNFRI